VSPFLGAMPRHEFGGPPGGASGTSVRGARMAFTGTVCPRCGGMARIAPIPGPQASVAPRTASSVQLAQAGLGLMMATEPLAVVGSTWANLLPACHWKMNFCATVFSPALLNFTGPCTVCSVTPLCR